MTTTVPSRRRRKLAGFVALCAIALLQMGCDMKSAGQKTRQGVDRAKQGAKDFADGFRGR